MRGAQLAIELLESIQSSPSKTCQHLEAIPKSVGLADTRPLMVSLWNPSFWCALFCCAGLTGTV